VKRPQLNWSVVMLVSSIVALGCAAFEAQQSFSRHRDTVLGLLHDYAGIALFHYEAQVSQEMERFVAALHSMDPMYGPNLMRSPSHDWTTATAKPCPCMGEGLQAKNDFHYFPSNGMFETRYAMAPESRDAILREIQASVGPALEGTYVVRVVPGTQDVIAFHAMNTPSGELGILGRVGDLDQLAEYIGHESTRIELLPPTIAAGIPVDSLVHLAVYVPGSKEPLYTNASDADWFQAAEDALPLANGGLVLRASIREAYAPMLVVGGLPRSRLPSVLLLMAMSIGLAVLAVAQMRRERALVRARENFVTSVSHELRTPLAQMRLYIDTLRMGRASSQEERDWALSHVERETTRLTHLVENVLHVSRPKQVGGGPAPVADVSAEVAEVVESFRPLARSRRARLVPLLEPGAIVAIRREHLRQTLLNLLDNAVKYGPVGQQVTVEVATRGDFVEIAVSDEGPGVLPQERARIWEAYFRGSTPEALASGGTGVGLSIVRDLIEQAGGTVELEDGSTGARFVVRLPRIRIGPEAEGSVRAVHIS
jgi:signal transduction histidine kinase